MGAQLPLSAEFRKLIEARLTQTLKGIEDTLNQLFEKQKMSLQELKDELQSLEESFTILFQKWNLGNSLYAFI